jgi:hypothetical protein
MTPTMAVGITDHMWTVRELLALKSQRLELRINAAAPTMPTAESMTKVRFRHWLEPLSIKP